MSAGEDLRAWLVALSDMTSGELPEDAPLVDGLEWIVGAPDGTFEELSDAGETDPTVAEFLNRGRGLLRAYFGEKRDFF